MATWSSAGTTRPSAWFEASELTDEVLLDAGVERAAALVLVHDDEANTRAVLSARRLNPRLALAIRLYNRKLGQYLKDLLDQAAFLVDPDGDPEAQDLAPAA